MKFYTFLKTFTILFLNIGKTLTLELATCRMALGMQSEEIPDVALTASSSMDPLSLGPTCARIRNENIGGAWCPKEQVSMDLFEYLQIDFGKLKVITLIETQGRFDRGQGHEFTEQYVVNYQREDTGSWIRFKNRRGKEIFQGNVNTYMAELREVSPPIIARKIRLHPYSNQAKYVCLRVELYGCDWTDGVLSYDMHQGERRGSELDLFDFTYDGILSSGYLSGGIGQLMDGEEGQSNFRLDPKNLGLRGYEWVGWKSDTFGGNPIEITFKFDAVRNFSYVKLFCNNLFSREVRVFSSVKVFFGNDGQQYLAPPIDYEFARDELMEYAREVTIPLRNSVGRYVKLWLFFDSRWMMVSEIQFESDLLVDHSLIRSAIANHTTQNRTKNITVDQAIKQKSFLDSNNINKQEGNDVMTSPRVHSYLVSQHHSDKDVAMINILISRTTQQYEEFEDEVVNRGELEAQSDRYIVIIAVVLTSVALAICLVIVMIIRHRRYTCMPISYPLPNVAKTTLKVYVPSPSFNSPISTAEIATDSLSKSSIDPIYDNIPCASQWMATEIKSLSAACESLAKFDQTLPAVGGFVDATDEDGYCIPEEEDLISAVQYAHDQIRFVHKLGESAFGEVHLSEITKWEGSTGTASSTDTTNTHEPSLAVVRWLKTDADNSTREKYFKEAQTLLQLKHSNIAQVIGLHTTDEPFAMLVEYSSYGDLKYFLKQHCSEADLATHDTSRLISYGSLVYMASQIASGMKVMESMNIFHQDLAARNCLVDHLYTIKISNLAYCSGSPRHRDDYYYSDYEMATNECQDKSWSSRFGLPIRWMSCEAVIRRKCSSKSDVWSFGVTMWEILTLARMQPLNNLTDEQVIENCRQCCTSNEHIPVLLDRPQRCSKELYDLMIACFNPNPFYRPTFKEIHMFLQQKNMGYNPYNEMH